MIVYQSAQPTTTVYNEVVISQANLSKKLDEEFVLYMLEVENRYKTFSKHDRIRIENWVIIIIQLILLQSKILCQVTTNMVWKRNRNLYTMLLLDQILNQRLETPFLTGPPDGGSNGLPILSKTSIVGKNIFVKPFFSKQPCRVSSEI